MALTFAAKLAISAVAALIAGSLWTGIYILHVKQPNYPNRHSIKLFLQNASLALISLSFSFVFAEVAYRIYLYHAVREQLVRMVADNLDPAAGLDVFDSGAGYRYRAYASFTNIGPFKDAFRINQFGLVANDLDPSSYTMAKPEGEYRIAVLGDSFAAGLQNYLRWPDFLQDYLNRSPQWRQRVGGKFTRVLNFGLDGTGLVQWSKVYRSRSSRFAPDLVLVSFVTDDIRRRFIYRGNVAGVANFGRAAIRDFLEKNVLNELPWYGLHSELIATVGSLFTNTDRRLTAAAAYETYTSFPDRAISIRQSISSLEQIRCMNPNTLILHDPMFEEMKVRQDTQQRYPYDTGNPPRWVGLETEFLAAAKEHHIDIVQLLERNPVPGDPSRIPSLYNIPIDTHHSDYGALLYARWVFRYLLHWGASHTDEQVVNSSCQS